MVIERKVPGVGPEKAGIGLGLLGGMQSACQRREQQGGEELEDGFHGHFLSC